ncbi:hypothetical protein ACP70R_023274 [Stipagrostis hirtigluma subsp. patula]
MQIRFAYPFASPVGVSLTLVSTPRNVAALRASSAAAAPFLRFHALPFVPEEHGLPAGAESTDALHVRDFLALFAATESPSLRAAFDGFLAGAGAVDGEDSAQVCDAVVVVVVADPFLAWTTGVARRHGARHAIFVSCGAFGSAVYHSLWNHLPHLRGGDTFRLPDHPEATVHRSQLPVHLVDADGTDWWSAFHRRQISMGHDTDALVVNTTEELEPAGLRMLRRTMGVPVWPVGPLLGLLPRRSDDGDGEGIVRWLDAREARSVLYISFGSQNSLRPDQMTELAAALELTGRPFVWAIRPPPGFDDGDDSRWLPEGFEARARGGGGGGRGLLLRGWAPQLRILAHASTGAFLSHCGWNSVLESVAHGVPRAPRRVAAAGGPVLQRQDAGGGVGRLRGGGARERRGLAGGGAGGAGGGPGDGDGGRRDAATRGADSGADARSSEGGWWLVRWSIGGILHLHAAWHCCQSVLMHACVRLVSLF